MFDPKQEARPALSALAALLPEPLYTPAALHRQPSIVRSACCQCLAGWQTSKTSNCDEPPA